MACARVCFACFASLKKSEEVLDLVCLTKDMTFRWEYFQIHVWYRQFQDMKTSLKFWSSSRVLAQDLLNQKTWKERKDKGKAPSLIHQEDWALPGRDLHLLVVAEKREKQVLFRITFWRNFARTSNSDLVWRVYKVCSAKRMENDWWNSHLSTEHYSISRRDIIPVWFLCVALDCRVVHLCHKNGPCNDIKVKVFQ